MFETQTAWIGGPLRGGFQSNLECLAIVARSHGLKLDTPRIVADNSLPEGRRVSTRRLLRCARRAGLKAKVLKLARFDLRRWKGKQSIIVTLKSGASMVLVGYVREGNVPHVRLQDPATPDGALLILDLVRFEQACTGEIILIWRDYALSDPQQPFSARLIRSFVFRDRRLVRDLVISATVLESARVGADRFLATADGSGVGASDEPLGHQYVRDALCRFRYINSARNDFLPFPSILRCHDYNSHGYKLVGVYLR